MEMKRYPITAFQTQLQKRKAKIHIGQKATQQFNFSFKNMSKSCLGHILKKKNSLTKKFIYLLNFQFLFILCRAAKRRGFILYLNCYFFYFFLYSTNVFVRHTKQYWA